MRRRPQSQVLRPARSIEPVVLIGGWALSQFRLFIIAPLIAAALASAVNTATHQPDVVISVKEVVQTIGVNEPRGVPSRGQRTWAASHDKDTQIVTAFAAIHSLPGSTMEPNLRDVPTVWSRNKRISSPAEKHRDASQPGLMITQRAGGGEPLFVGRVGG